jgi:hypothetical protein
MMDTTRKSGPALAVAAIFVLICAVVGVTWYVTKPPSLDAELEQLDARYESIEAEVTLLMDSFEPTMKVGSGVMLHQMELKAKQLEKEWSKDEYHHPQVIKAQREMSFALIGFGGAYGFGYIDTITGRDPANDDNAIDQGIEAINHFTAFHKHRAELLALTD